MSARLTAAWRGGDAQQRPGWCLQFSYDEETVDALKRAVPAAERSWNPETTTWWVSEAYADAAARVLPGLDAYRAQIALF